PRPWLQLCRAQVRYMARTDHFEAFGTHPAPVRRIGILFGGELLRQVLRNLYVGHAALQLIGVFSTLPCGRPQISHTPQRRAKACAMSTKTNSAPISMTPSAESCTYCPFCHSSHSTTDTTF